MQPLVFFLSLLWLPHVWKRTNTMTHHLRGGLDLREVLVPSTASPRALFQSCVFLSAPNPF